MRGALGLSLLLRAAMALRPPQTIALDALLSTCADACARGCARIVAARADGAQGDATLKIADDPKSALTKADLAAQSAVVGSLSRCWPGLRVVGEEDETAPDDDVQAGEPLDRSLKCGLGTAPLDDVCVFVDPLDGTREFVEGRLDNARRPRLAPRAASLDAAAAAAGPVPRGRVRERRPGRRCHRLAVPSRGPARRALGHV